MTEAEWQKSDNPREMVAALHGKVSDRKLRLFGYMCCRRVVEFIADPLLSAGIEVINAYADDLISRADLVEVEKAAVGSLRSRKPEEDDSAQDAAECLLKTPKDCAELAARLLLTWNDPFALGGAGTVAYHACSVHHDGSAYHRDQTWQCCLLKDICGPLPFRSITIDPSWLTSTVIALAKQMYDSHNFSSMSILADALQDTGCDNTDILDHCRGPGPHVRGCWLVDKLLSKE